MATINKTDARLDTHEEVCTLRYAGLCTRLKRIENIGVVIAGAIIMLLINIIIKVN
jgi:hypothetical protein